MTAWELTWTPFSAYGSDEIVLKSSQSYYNNELFTSFLFTLATLLVVSYYIQITLKLKQKNELIHFHYLLHVDCCTAVLGSAIQNLVQNILRALR